MSASPLSLGRAPRSVQHALPGDRRGPPARDRRRSVPRVEVTENGVMVDAERTVAALLRLRELGVRISIDDFGTGHSSLARLKKLPADELKIDKGFVLQIEHDDRGAAIVEAAVALGERLGLGVVAEGVESEAAWDRLHSLGCRHAQGFLLSRALPPDELGEWVRTRAVSPVALAS